MPKYDAIFFDMGETLVYHQPSHEEVFYQVLEQLGWPVSAAQRSAGMRWSREAMSSFDARLRDDGVTLKDLETEFFYAYLKAIGLDGLPDDVIERIKEGRRKVRQKMVCPSEVHDLLTELHQGGYHLAIVSNWDDSLGRHCEEHDLSRYFNGIYASMEVGSSKPDAGIFQHALAHAGVEADRALHVGDNYYADVLGARAVGIDAVLLDQHQLHPSADCLVMTTLGDLRKHL